MKVQQVLMWRVLDVLRDRCGESGRCWADLTELAWALKLRWQDDPRPTVGEVAEAVEELVRRHKVEKYGGRFRDRMMFILKENGYDKTSTQPPEQ